MYTLWIHVCIWYISYLKNELDRDQGVETWEGLEWGKGSGGIYLYFNFKMLFQKLNQIKLGLFE